ncbi:protein fem-1 homolog A [Ostrinia furnacalis]|uniref:protein fem-1 homolog A n=1 Tax=Ostrinia furnacalis TaxID=93504 RepID=UPI001039E5BC|nr:protein fem-1 homolog A [Ostrinia furnacalis]XP_028176417.1 protein fem-1 homolog A [Ostrinia furnacalis]
MWEEGSSNSAGSEKGGAKYVDITKHHDAVFNELMRECKHSAPGARLSARLRTSLERMCPEERRAVVCRTAEGCAPLFVASKRGNVELVEYLVHVCAAELEQRGVYEVPDDRSVHTVTPLWCAAVEGRLDALGVLADAGARVDAPSDSGSTPVRSACFMTHLDVVRFLVQRGADIHRPNHNGGTCLINSVQSVRLCTFLLEHGAQVDALDMQHKTALHYAIQEHRVETARLLLEHGADPHLASRAGDDALRTACLKGAAQIVALLAARVRYPAARLADAYELLGATQLDEFNDVAAALAAWRRATAIRHAGPVYVEKTPVRPLHPALGGAAEWRTPGELEAAATDMDALRTQALLVCARVLGPAHKDTVLRLMYRGASYGDAFRYQRCIELWTWALEIRIQKDSLLYTDTCHTACALTRLMLDARAGRLERGRDLPRHQDVVSVFRLLAADLPACRRALEVRPVFKKQAETFDRALRCVTHLVYLLLDTADTPEEREEVVRLVRALVAADVRSAHTGDTLLHLSVSCLNVIRSTYFADEVHVPPIFPSVAVVRLLLQCGAGVGTRNEARSTALHVAAIPYNFSSELVGALLAGGAHIDQPNKFGDLPAELVALNRGNKVKVLQHMTLACVAARALLASGRPVPRSALPRTLHDFLDLHRP